MDENRISGTAKNIGGKSKKEQAPSSVTPKLSFKASLTRLLARRRTYTAKLPILLAKVRLALKNGCGRRLKPSLIRPPLWPSASVGFSVARTDLYKKDYGLRSPPLTRRALCGLADSVLGRIGRSDVRSRIRPLISSSVWEAGRAQISFQKLSPSSAARACARAGPGPPCCLSLANPIAGLERHPVADLRADRRRPPPGCGGWRGLLRPSRPLSG